MNAKANIENSTELTALAEKKIGNKKVRDRDMRMV